MKNTYLILFSLILLSSSCGNSVESPYEPIEFKKLNTMPGNGRSSAVAFAINGKGYVALGRDAGRSALKDCWEYNPTDSTWLKKESFPGIGRVKAMATVLNGKAYVGLGFDFDNDSAIYNVNAYLKDFWMYDPENDTWTQKASFPSTATDACVSFAYKNNIYVGGGFNGWGFTSEFWKYSPENDSWVRLNNFPAMERAGSILCASDEHIYYGTGYRTLNENDWWEYFPETDSWTKRNSMPDKGRENGVSFTLDNRYFVSTGRQFGGNLTGGHVKSDIMEYDATRDVWYKRGNIPNGARENAIAFSINGKGYIGFGENETQVLNDFWSFEP
jgi:N-acetylneuraminic acid mutarotase